MKYPDKIRVGSVYLNRILKPNLKSNELNLMYIEICFKNMYDCDCPKIDFLKIGALYKYSSYALAIYLVHANNKWYTALFDNQLNYHIGYCGKNRIYPIRMMINYLTIERDRLQAKLTRVTTIRNKLKFK